MLSQNVRAGPDLRSFSYPFLTQALDGDGGAGVDVVVAGSDRQEMGAIGDPRRGVPLGVADLQKPRMVRVRAGNGVDRRRGGRTWGRSL